MILPADAKLVNTFSRSHGISNSKEKAEIFKDGGCRWKEETGPDSDRSDRRLATPARQSSSRVPEIAMTLQANNKY